MTRRGEEHTTFGRYPSVTTVLSSRESLVHLILSCQIEKRLEVQDCMDESKPRLRLCRFSVGMESKVAMMLLRQLRTQA